MVGSVISVGLEIPNSQGPRGPLRNDCGGVISLRSGLRSALGQRVVDDGATVQDLVGAPVIGH